MKIVVHEPGKPDNTLEAPPRISLLMMRLREATHSGAKLLANRVGYKPTSITYDELKKLVDLSRNDELHIHIIPKEQSDRSFQQSGTKVKVAMYVPTFRSDDCDALLKDLKSKLTYSVKQGAQFFLAPEYFFTKKDGRPFSPTDKQKLDTALRGISAIYPDVLIIAGTILWFDEKKNKFFNTALVLYQGSVTGYYKMKVYVDDSVMKYNDRLMQDAGHRNYDIEPGDVPQLDLLVRDLSCRIQICADAIYTKERNFDLQFIASSVMGALNSHAHEGGWTFVADRDAGSRVFVGGWDLKRGAAEPVQKAPPGECLIVEKEVRRLAQPPKLVVQDLRPP